MSKEREIEKIFSLTPMQEGMLFHFIKDRGSTAYFEQYLITLRGKIHKALFEKSLNIAIKRHDVLRTLFVYEKIQKPKQVVLKDVNLEINFVDISYLKEAEEKKYLEEFKRQDRQKGFNLTKEIPMRVTLFKIGTGNYKLLWSFHHITMDGWSFAVFLKELIQIYLCLKKGDEISLETGTRSFSDYIGWLDNQDREEGLAYWRDYLQGYEQPAGLPKPAKPPWDQNRQHSAENHDIEIPGEITTALNRAAAAHQVTVNSVYRALWGILLQKYNNTEDVVFGTVVSGRPPEIQGIENMVGLFINTIPVRIKCGLHQRFSQVIVAAQTDAAASRSYEYLPLADIQASSLLKVHLIDHILVFENYPVQEEIKKPGKMDLGFEIEGVDIQSQTSYDFNIIVTPGKRFSIKLMYNGLVYDRGLIKRTARHFEKIVRQVKENPEIEIKDIEIITAEEKRQILTDFNQPDAGNSPGKSIHELFAEQAEETPDNIAVVGPLQVNYRTYMTYMTYITYRELNEKSHQLAHLLREKGVMEDNIVGIMVERSIEMIVGILAILKAGGAYLPIDLEYPEARQAYMLKDSGTRVLLTRPGVKVKAEARKGFIEIIDISDLLSYSTLTSTPTCQVSPTNLVYIIYTSGSTGKPKGVLLEHMNVVNLLIWNFTHTDMDFSTVLQFSTICFDVSFQEIFSTLLSGGKLCMIHERTRTDIPGLFEIIEKQKIKTLFLPMSMLIAIFSEKDYIEQFPACVRHIQTAGEQVVINDKLRDFLKENNVFLHNHYGPSETHVVTALTLPPRGEIPPLPPIGKPVSNTRILILNKYKNLQPIGVPGELYIGGVQVGRGYLNRPELTAEKFDQDLWDYRDYQDEKKANLLIKNYKQKISQKLLRGVQGGGFLEKSPPGRRRQKIYKTGDLACWLPDGNIEFLGRIDHQVKIRGFRIEPGEIENRLLAHQQIKAAVVSTGEDGMGDKYLCAYIVSDSKVNPPAIRKYLSNHLPDYMLPAYFIPIEQIPLTPSGKVDRKALPIPNLETVNDYVPPGDEVEKKLVDIWSEVLYIDRNKIGIHANFFDMGGHSLKAIILMAKIHKELNIKVPLAEMFKHQSIKKLSGYIKNLEENIYAGIKPVEKREYYDLSSAQKRLYFIQQMDINSTVYNMPLVLPLGKDINKDRLESTLRRLISRHESLRTSFIKVNEIPYQQVHDKVEFEMEYKEKVEVKVGDQEGTRGLAPLPEDLATRNPQLATSTLKNFIRPFDLTHAPLMRSALIQLPDNNYTWIVDTHHIISDGTSHTILTEDFISMYNGDTLEPMPLHYKDYSGWQNNLFASGGIKAQEDYWLRLYSTGEIPRLHMPQDYKRPEVFTFAGNNYSFMLEREEALKFKALGSRYGATLYMNTLAALNTLFYKYTGQADIIIGSGIAGRPHADLQRIIGMFVNTLAMRNYPHGEKSYENFLKEVTTNSINAFENQDVQFEELVDKLDPERDPSRNPLFDISMVVQNFRISSISRPHPETNENRGAPWPPEAKNTNPTAKFDMTFFLRESEDDIYIDIEYYTGIFKEETINRLASHLKNVIASAIREPSLKLKDIDIIPKKEKEKVLNTFNETTREYPADKTIHELFTGQVERTPDYIALHGCIDAWVHEGGHITYRELNKKSNQLAHYLYGAKRTQPDDRVGLLLSLPLYQAISILGVLKSGAAYVPIDPRLPEKRIKYMINDAAIGTIISEKRYVKLLNRLQWECDCFHSYLCVDSFKIHEEDEVERSELMTEELWNHVGETAADDITGGGWISSYTGEPFSRKEMDEYAHNILEKLEPLLRPMIRVLEIGCASGISMFRIAPKVGIYYGTDLSSVIIEKNKKRVEREGPQNIKLSCLPAHEIDKIGENNFHLVIINSVIQCFHGHNYLRKVIRKSIDLLADEGYLFPGDIMDLEKKESMIRELKDFKYSNIDKGYTTKTNFSTELFLSRGYWKDLGIEFEEIQSIEFSDKIHTIENELTKFRYDVLITIKKTTSTAKQQKQKYQDDMHHVSGWGLEKVPAKVLPGNLAYIIYTSGSTGKPKGVEVQHQGVVNTLLYRKHVYDMNPGFVSLQLFSYSFDGFVTSFFTPIISGARVVLMENEKIKDIEKIRNALVRNNTTHFISVPSLYSTLIDSLTGKEISTLKVVTLAGERVPLNVLETTKRKNKTLEIVNEYGVTESSVMSTIYRHQEKDNTIKIGQPIGNTKIYILDGNDALQPIGIPGQLCLSGIGLARGYLNNPQLTKQKFCLRRPGGRRMAHGALRSALCALRASPRKSFSLGYAPGKRFYMSYRSHRSYIYKTGDLARWHPDSSIEFLGRIDQQVKIRGFRIELGEIENQLLALEGIKAAIVVDRLDESGQKYLCGYFVSKQALNPSDLKTELLKRLPDYMVPNYLLPIETISLTPSGKVNRNALPSPKTQKPETYTAPQDSIEKKLVKIWSEILGVDNDVIGIDNNFFDLGGHSLKATILTSKIHKELKIKVPLAKVFKRPTIRELSAYIKRAEQDKYAGIEPEEKKEYYDLSSAQKRIYFLQQLDLNSTVYNMPLVLPLGKDINKDRLESTLIELISRHESLRTSFIKVKEIPYQQIHDKVEFEMEYKKEVEVKVGDQEGTRGLAPLPEDLAARNSQLATSTLKNFIRPFDLSRAPLMRSALIQLPDNNHTWIVDMHHIISDGTSHTVLEEDFIALYAGQELPGLRLHYKDFSQWQNRLFKTGKIKTQENYWHNLYSSPQNIPRLNLPLDFKRPEVFTFTGDIYHFNLATEYAKEFKALGTRNGTTLYMNILAVLNTLFYKYTGQTDIIMGSTIAGRPNADLQRIIGMFVNTLAMRNYPYGERSYDSFLKEVAASSIKAFENQDLQFEELVDQLDLERDPSRTPLFDICMVVQNFRLNKKLLQGVQGAPWHGGPIRDGFVAEDVFDNSTFTCNLHLSPLAEKSPPGRRRQSIFTKNTNPTAKFDMTFSVNEIDEEIFIEIEYYTGIFREETIKRLVSHIKNIIKTVVAQPSIKIKDIDMLSQEEKKQVLYECNQTAGNYPKEKTIHELFEDQAASTDDRIALLGGINAMFLTYRQLNEKSNRLANYLFGEKNINPGDMVGILMDNSFDLIIAILGILKAGAAYIPIDPSLPEERTGFIIRDTSIGTVISSKKYIKTLNRLQWESQCFHTYLCMDSQDIYKEAEAERSQLMDEELWHHVGETAEDEIAGGGWVSSYTGEKFSRQEMDEYGNNTLEKLEPLLHKNMRVLEIGTASGITMFRIAPKVGFYYGTDLSRVIIEKNKKRAVQEGHQNIKLACLPAHEIHQLEEKDFDLIIINSVIHCFHGHQYLRKVMAKLIDLLGREGYIFIGDIMDQDLKENLIRDMREYKRTHIMKNSKTKTDWSTELFVSRGFFEDISVDFPLIVSMEFSKKIYTLENELTKFRYDALLSVNKGVKPGKTRSPKHKYQEDIRVLERYSTSWPGSGSKPGNTAYIIYTSGTTGKPKGVMIRHQSLVNYIHWASRQYVYKQEGQLTFPLYTNVSFDLTVTSIYLPLITGNRIAIYGQEKNRLPIIDVISENKVEIIKATPSHLKILQEDITTKNTRLKRFIVGGEELETQLARDVLDRFKKKIEIFNEYGPTEATVGCMIYQFDETRDKGSGVPIGKPIDNTGIYILDSDLKPVPPGAIGEIYISGDALAQGYLNDPGLTAEKFIFGSYRFYRSYRSYKSYVLYRTGDLARFQPEGNIEFLGRKDQQVKIRGYRIELKEIENYVLEHDGVKETVVLARERKSRQPGEEDTVDISICCYWVPVQKENPIETAGIKEYLSGRLPAYMVPSYFVKLDKIPLTPNGKVDRKVLPEPGTGERDKNYIAPRNRLEEKLAEIWSRVLGIEKGIIGINSNFFRLGGHSLKATILTAKIHKELNIKVPLAEVFKNQGLKELARYMENSEENRYAGIEPEEKREYYDLSSAQKRIYFLQQLDLNSTVYNMPLVLPLGKDINKDRLEFTLRSLISRHESLRTSFIKVKEIPYQQVHDKVEFEMEYKKEVEVKVSDQEGTRGLAPLPKEPAARSPQPASALINSFIRPFDLSQAPLMRSALIQLPDNNHTWIVDMHHIISDGTSHMVLEEDFMTLYAGKELPLLRLHYKDFSQWQNRLIERGKIKNQENYWLELYPSPKDIPRLNLPLDFKRPEVFTFTGDNYSFILEKEEALKFKALGSRKGATLYMNILAALNTLFYKYTGQADIIIGSGIAGRPHADLQDIIGMFVNTLVMRNYPESEKTYETFLNEVTVNCINAFENQDVQFEELVDKLYLERDPSRNPLFDISMVVQNFRSVDNKNNRKLLQGVQGDGFLEKSPPGRRRQSIFTKNTNPTAKFDMTFFIDEVGEDIYIRIEYYTGIFKEETIKRLVQHFKNLVKAVVRAPSIRLKDIDIVSGEEKQQLIYEFNDTAVDYPADKTIHELFALQAERTPDHVALVGAQKFYQEGTRGLAPLPVPEFAEFVTYRELNKKSSQITHYLCKAKGIQPEDRVGILLSQSLYRPIAILGILKAGAAYVPIDPSLPAERVKYMIDDASLGVVISGKKYVKDLNRLQWECHSFHSYLCLDSFDIHEEDETETNELMDRELWRHVGEAATDDITGGGWISSYTGKPFSKQEMDEYGDNILQKLTPLLHPKMRILEIGCASGISMYRIASKVGFYYGTDLSAVIIEKNKKRIKEENRQNIKLACLAAHEIHNLEERNFHLIIINSVIQCFHGHNYLRKVIGKSIDLLADEGYLFLGDIMDLDKKEAMIRELKDFKYSNKDKEYTTKTDFSSELFLSRGFWSDLDSELEEIQSIESGNKIHTIENELTKFRYDVIAKINKKPVKKKKRQKQKHQDDLQVLPGFGSSPPELTLPSHSLAYLIYTSGTTGQPKGVAIQHGSLVNLCYWHNRYYWVTGVDHASLYAGFGFDASVWELFPYLITGASLYIVPDSIRLDIEKLFDYFKQHQITISFLPTQFCEQFLSIETGNSFLRVLLTGGDKLHTFVNRDYALYNNYGPTENTVVSTSYLVEKYCDNIPIGKPIDNTMIYILVPKSLQIQPVGVPGELCIGGTGLARGYLNNPELTAQKFCLRRPGALFEKTAPGPHKNFLLKGAVSGIYRSSRSHRSYIYKTGDLARWLSDGNIEFLGRIDQQVKIRGFRIELEEIESQLLEIEEIKEAVVVDRLDESGQKYLCAYFVTKQAPDPSNLKAELLKRLPDYMIPGYLMPIETIPLNPSGKVNRNALPSPEIQRPGEYAGPRDIIEKRLVEIWCEVLGRDASHASHSPPGIDDNFFDLGGHSLKATILTSKILKELNIKVPLAEVFKHPTIRGLSFFINASGETKFTPIEPAEKKEYYPLSSAQARFYILQQVTPDITAYNMAAVHQVKGYVEKEKFEDALKKLIKRHETLRTSFQLIDSQPVQQVHHEVKFEIEYKEVKVKVEGEEGTRGLAPLPKEPAAALISSFLRPFDLSQAPLLRLGLIKISPDHHILMFDMHHIVTDGTSITVFLAEFMKLYTAPGADDDLPKLSLQYKDFSHWQYDRLRSGKLKEQEAYWWEQFPGEPPVLNMPYDFPRPSIQGFEGDQFDFTLEKSLTRKLNHLIKETGTTLFMVLLAVYNILLARYTGQEDIVIGTTIAGRSHPDLDNIIGLLIETLALRNYPSGNLSFEEFLNKVKQTTLKAYENQDYPFKELIKKVWDENDLSRNPVFDAMLIVQNFEPGEFELEGLRFFPYESPGSETPHMSKVDFTIEAMEAAEEIYFSLEYCTRLFKRETMERLVGHFINIIREVVNKPEVQLSVIEMINEQEKTQILEEFNHATLEYIPMKMVHELFADQVEGALDNIALVGPVQKKNRTYMTYMTNISYKELNEKSNHLAHWLIKKGIQPDTIVGIMVEPSIEMFIGLWGILKTGAAYLPIDLDYPEERIQFMLNDSNAGILITHKDIKPSPSTLTSTLTCRVSPANLAYIIYTSGSTGRPKGVMVEHRNLTTYINAFEREFDLRPDDTVIQQVSYAFDAFVEELYPILLKGGKLAIPGRKVTEDIHALYDFIVKHQVTMITCSPQLLNEMNSSPGLLASLRILISGGDCLKAEHIGNLKKVGDVYNTYGPTEATVCATYYRCPNHSKLPANVSIGKPISNYRVYILDKYNNILPISIPGELCIAGAGVARGYLNKPELTSERFYMSYRSHLSYIYKTGDLARWLGDGNIEFLGRIDRQVKVRGYRIELGEIENRLTALENIKEAVLVERERKSGQNFLAAYVVSKGPTAVTEVKSRLARQLPGYMIPTYIIEIDEIPLTLSGKIDQKRLPLPGAVSDQPYAPPASDKEKLVADIWKQVLEKDRVGLDDNFFDLGGTSLDIFKVNTRLKEIFNKQIPTVMMFKHSTIRSLAGYIAEKEKQVSILEEKHKEMINAAASGNTLLKKITQRGIKMHEKIEKDDHNNGFEIAVIGMAAQFPGAKDIREFWENLKNGVESIGFFSDEELQAEGIEVKILENPNYIKARGIITGVEYFDSSFFGYASTEAQIMDPQVRIFLQCVWHGLEDAGYDPFSYDRRIGLYAGASPNLSWEGLTSLSGFARGFSGFMIAQLADKDFMCTHISYKLNLNGPSVSIQTACSTSLAAVHWAVRGLLTGECEIAIAGGVSIAFPSKQGYLYQGGMIFSPDGHNKTFDAEAGGSVFGDGVGVVVLKPLVYAARDRDHIYAIIKGSAINNDGYRKVGYTAPSIDGQAEVIKSAQSIAGVEPGSITYIEAHGTATPLGDTVEIEALKQAFNTGKKGFCGIGTVKSNVGHLYSAAGAAGFIKTVLALKHRLIPPSLHFKTPNPGIDFENTPFYVNTELKEWKSEKYPLRAGVSSFGIGGTNVHVILEENSSTQSAKRKAHSVERESSEGTGGLAPLPDAHSSHQYQLILLSAKTPSALDKMTENLTAYFKKNPVNPGQIFADLAYTLQAGRKHFPYRRMAVCAANDAEPQKLALDIRRIPTALVKEENRPVVFMFCGQGSQYVNMGIDLYRTEPIFREEMDRCFEILKSLMEYDLKEILYPDLMFNRFNRSNRSYRSYNTYKSNINQTEVAQPLIFAIEYALAKLLMHWGIKPYAMIGYSFGEYIAACIAGVFSLEDALKLITIRAQLIGKTPAGAMTSVPLPVKKLTPLLNKNLSLAIINGPTCIVSGAKTHVQAFEKEMKKKRVMCVPLNMSRAIHSNLMEPIRKEFENRIQEFRLKEPRILYISNVTAGWITAKQAVNPVYWGDHLCSTVRFSEGLEELLKEKNAIFIEIGAGRILGMMVRTHPDKKPGHMVLNTVKHQQEKVSDDYFLLEKIGQLWLQGQRINWTEFYREEKRYRLPLPGYPFEGKRYWLDMPANVFKPGEGVPLVSQASGTASGIEPSPALESSESPAPFHKDQESPGSELEQAIVQVWQEFLGIEPIGIHDNFFQLNGNSLIAVQLIARLNEEYQVEIPMSRFYEDPTIAHLASVIKELLSKLK